MKKLFFSTAFIFNALILASQLDLPARPYEPLRFENFNPIWYETSYDLTMISDSCDGYNYFMNIEQNLEPVLNDRSLFNLYHLNGKRGSPTGAFIEKRNIEDGKIEWTAKYDLYDTDHKIDVARKLFIENDSLILISQKGLKKYPGETANFGIHNTLFAKRVYHLHMGALLSHDFVEAQDSNVTHLTYASPKWAFFNYVFKEGKNYRFIRPIYLRLNGNDYLKNVGLLLDEHGIQIGEADTVAYDSTQVNFNLMQIARDTYLRVQVMKDKNEIHFDYLDNQLEKYKTIVSEKVVGLGDVLLRKYENGIFILHEYVKDTLDESKYIEWVSWYNVNGKKLGRFKIPETAMFKNVFWHDQTQQMIMTSLYLKVISNDSIERMYLDISKLNSDDTSENLKKIFIDDDYRFFRVENSIEAENGDLIFVLYEGSLNLKGGILQQDHNANAYSQMRVSAQELGLITKTKEEIVSKIDLLPSVTADEIVVKNVQSGDVIVYDLQGKIVLKTKISQQSNNFINVQSLEAGLYYIKVSNKEEIKTGKFIKI